MSRSQIREVIDSGQFAPQEIRQFQTSYEEKLARPFASFVFTLIAVPFGLRPARGGGGHGLGLRLRRGHRVRLFRDRVDASALTASLPGGYLVSALGAWAPNVLFTAIGALLLARAARY